MTLLWNSRTGALYIPDARYIFISKDRPIASRQTHRTQEQRRAETRGKLLNAAISSLLDHGYAATTTRSVAALAEVSPGAMAHYYPRRVDLVAAAAEALVEQRLAAWREALADDLEQRIPALLDRLWEDSSGPAFAVFVKLWVAAADDADLHERLVESQRRIAQSITEVAVGALRHADDRAGWEGRVLITLAAIRGLALTERLEPRAAARADPWPSARAALLDMLGVR